MAFWLVYVFDWSIYLKPDFDSRLQKLVLALVIMINFADHLDISQHEADKNFSDIGGLVKEEEPTLTLEILRAKYPEAFTSTSEAALAEVLAEANLGHSLSAFQETAVNGMLNGQDVVCIVPTGAGKMLVLGCFKISRIPIN